MGRMPRRSPAAMWTRRTRPAAQELAAAQNITLLEPSEAQDQNALAVTDEFAQANSLVSLSDLAAYSEGEPVRLGGPPECQERPFCEPVLEDVDGVQTQLQAARCG
jgi:osmoprotectant transport system substrate-binding protein